MANFHLNSKVGTRKGGQSAKAKASYILRDGKYKKAVPPSFSLSGNMPSWAKQNPILYWESADKNERANGTLFRGVEFALPLELTADQRQQLAEYFCEDLASYQNQKMPYTLAIHDDAGNPHCHFMMSERANDGHDRSADLWFKRANKNSPEKGGALKLDIGSKRKQWLMDTRKSWEVACNLALEKRGHDARIDHRSNLDRGIHTPPKVYDCPWKKTKPEQKDKRKKVADSWFFNQILKRNEALRKRTEFMFDRGAERLSKTVKETLVTATEFAEVTKERIFLQRDIVPVSAGLRRIYADTDLLERLSPSDLKDLEKICNCCVKIHNQVKAESPIVFKDLGDKFWTGFKNKVLSLRADVSRLKPEEPKEKHPSPYDPPSVPTKPRYPRPR